MSTTADKQKPEELRRRCIPHFPERSVPASRPLGPRVGSVSEVGMLGHVYDWLYRIVKLFRVPIHWVFGSHPELSQLVESGRIKAGRALDLGCGTGREVIYLAQHGFDATGVDISPTAIRMAREAADAVGVEARFIVDDLTEMSRVEGSFDLLMDYGAINDLNQNQRDAYMSRVLPLASDGAQFVLMCFDNKLPLSEIEGRLAGTFSIELVSSKGETGTRRTISTYLLHKHSHGP